MSDAKSELSGLSKGFRNRYLDYDTLTAQLECWAARYPRLLRLEPVGETPEGRTLWVAIVGRDSEEKRPAFWIDANMHAAELCGSSVALALIEDVLALHLSPNDTDPELPESVAEVAREVLFYVMPRISPDGAEAVLKTGRSIRSVPRDARLDTGRASWRAKDLDGDGLSLMMRYQDETGEFVESREEPGLMLRREVGDSGPYFQLVVEGMIDNYDGSTIPRVGAFDDNFPDLNRNFPWSWAPEPEQEGAGPFPTSEPESRAVVEFATRHPNIFAWADLHTFGGVFIRPLGHAPDTEMNGEDLAVYNQLAQWAMLHTGYPTVSGFAEFTYSPNRPLRGDIVDFAYHQRGALAYTCELWDLFKRLGLGQPARFAEYYVRLSRSEHKALWRWDREHNQGRIFCPWRAITHPQLGPVEVGGVDPRVGIWNPPEDQLPEVCRGQVAVMLRVAAMAPRVRLQCLNRTRLDGDLWRATLQMKNLGYLASHGLASVRDGALGEPPRLEITERDCELISPATRRLPLRHLAGWGRGLYSLESSILSAKSGGSASTQELTLTVRGGGSLHIRLLSPRLGAMEVVVRAPEA